MVCPVTSQADEERQTYSSTQPQHSYGVGGLCRALATSAPRKMWYPWYMRLYGSGKFTPCQGLNPGLSSTLQVAIQTMLAWLPTYII